MNYKNQDDPLKYSVHEDAFEKGALENQRLHTKSKMGFQHLRK